MLKTFSIDAKEVNNAKKRVRLGQWLFEHDWTFLGWTPLSACLCKSGDIALFPVRSIDIEVKPNAVMPNIIGVNQMKPQKHYFLIVNTGLKGLDWQKQILNRKQ